MSKRKHVDKGKYRSHFELEVSEKFPEDSYESTELSYTIPAEQHKYVPDFTVTATDGHVVYVECKGRFRTKAEADKYLMVLDSNPGIDLRFIIMDKETLMPRSKKTTMYKWLTQHGIKVYLWPNIPKITNLK